MKFKNTTVHNIGGAIRSMRMPMMSHDKSDSHYNNGNFIIGEADVNNLRLKSRACKSVID